MKKQPLADLVEDVAERGLSSVQLALGKSFDFFTDTGCLNPGVAFSVGDAFRRRGIQIAVLGCYVNIIHPDLDARKKALQDFKMHLRFARDFGCGVVGTETGNVNREIAYTEDNFHEKPFMEVVKSVRELVDEAEKFGVVVGVEPGVNHPIYSPMTMRRLLDEVGSNNLQVIFDPVNLLTLGNYTNQHDIFDQALDLWGDRIVAVHAKDFYVADGAFHYSPPGQGVIDYPYLMGKLKERKPYVNIILDELDRNDIEAAKNFLNDN
ncbi:sugar phosphate isomerase/epimerase family protein [Franzmannia pantelleriensis]|uniref:sugar phosphate isomerase/epimerase family protein n=1 Tax=Franzmannia pantelleriensis TaxID=48727 RepID=UPI001FE0E0DE|nr:sugar phosphate isomerase/epimerase family protein [Halomonas pantelleriensis]